MGFSSNKVRVGLKGIGATSPAVSMSGVVHESLAGCSYRSSIMPARFSVSKGCLSSWTVRQRWAWMSTPSEWNCCCACVWLLSSGKAYTLRLVLWGPSILLMQERLPQLLHKLSDTGTDVQQPTSAKETPRVQMMEANVYLDACCARCRPVWLLMRPGWGASMPLG